MPQTVTLDDALIKGCISLSKANFSNLVIKSIDAKTKWEAITDLSFLTCSIEDVTFIPMIFPSVTMLKIVDCQIDEEQLHEFSRYKLIVLNISGCKLSKIPLSLLKPGLKALILSDNNITEIPPLLESIPKGPRAIKITYNLNTLILSKNPLTNESIKDRFSDFPSLRKVNFSECELTACPQILSASIREVRLSHNKISNISDSWTCLPKLRQLELGHNRILMIRDLSALTRTKWLHQLGLAGNPCMEREEVVAYLKKALAAVNPHMRINQIIVSSLTTQIPVQNAKSDYF